MDTQNLFTTLIIREDYKLSSTFIYHLNQRPEGTRTVRHIAASKIYVAEIVAVKELLHGDSFLQFMQKDIN